MQTAAVIKPTDAKILIGLAIAAVAYVLFGLAVMTWWAIGSSVPLPTQNPVMVRGRVLNRNGPVAGIASS